eukprot:2135446-Amphidinium_carterae.1
MVITTLGTSGSKTAVGACSGESAVPSATKEATFCEHATSCSSRGRVRTKTHNTALHILWFKGLYASE